MFLRHRFFLVLVAVILITGSGFAFAPLFTLGRWLTLALLVMVVADIVLLWHRRAISASRQVSDRFSNGDENSVTISVESSYPFPVRLEVIDEAPIQFQSRNLSFLLSPSTSHTYSLRPTRRGTYSFGHIRVFASTWLGLVERRYTCALPQDVKVYPSYQQLHQLELIAISRNLQEPGIKRIRRIGNNTEFEHIRDYLRGDDYRTVNWRATARLHRPMVNVYQQERSQQVFAIIDKGRVMQQAFDNMTLLDYAINASLALGYVAMHKEDRAGLITFTSGVETIVPADRRPGHIKKLLETLYAEQTDFGETDFSALCVHVNKHVLRTSLLVVYTNFIGMVALRRQLPFLRQLSRRHRVLVVFFEDVELADYAATPAVNEEDECRHVMAEKFIYEKQLMVSTLRQNGIYALLTAPDRLTADVVNRYLEMKSQGLLA